MVLVQANGSPDVAVVVFVALLEVSKRAPCLPKKYCNLLPLVLVVLVVKIQIDSYRVVSCVGRSLRKRDATFR